MLINSHIITYSSLARSPEVELDIATASTCTYVATFLNIYLFWIYSKTIFKKDKTYVLNTYSKKINIQKIYNGIFFEYHRICRSTRFALQHSVTGERCEGKWTERGGNGLGMKWEWMDLIFGERGLSGEFWLAYRPCWGGWLWSEDGFDIMDIRWDHRENIHRIEGLAVRCVRLNHIWSFITGLV